MMGKVPFKVIWVPQDPVSPLCVAKCLVGHILQLPAPLSSPSSLGSRHCSRGSSVHAPRNTFNGFDFQKCIIMETFLGDAQSRSLPEKREHVVSWGPRQGLGLRAFWKTRLI